MIRILAVLAALFCVAPALAQPLPANLDKANAIVIDTTKGRIVIKLRTDIAPQHAERIKQLARDGYYNNVPFHRVIAASGGGLLRATVSSATPRSRAAAARPSGSPVVCRPSERRTTRPPRGVRASATSSALWRFVCRPSTLPSGSLTSTPVPLPVTSAPPPNWTTWQS